MLTHIINFCTYRTTHERFSGNRMEGESLLISSQASHTPSLVGSIMKSDILVHDDAEINDFVPQNTKSRLSDATMVGNNYMRDMEYTKHKPQKPHNQKCG